MCEQLAVGCYTALSKWELNPRPIDRKSNALLIHHRATFLVSSDFYIFTPDLITSKFIIQLLV